MELAFGKTLCLYTISSLITLFGRLGKGIINLWRDSWCNAEHLKSRYPDVYAIAHNENLRVCDAFSDTGQCLVAVNITLL